MDPNGLDGIQGNMLWVFASVVFLAFALYGLHSLVMDIRRARIKNRLYQQYPEGFVYDESYYAPGEMPCSEIPEDAPVLDRDELKESFGLSDVCLESIDFGDFGFIDVAPMFDPSDGGG